MSRLALLASAAALACFALAGCAANGTLNPSTDTAIQNALAVGCPIVATVQASSLPLTSYEKSAVTTLALVCPPNPPPTSAVIAAEDIISAYMILEPLIK
jgi:hypothetical protein